MFIGRTNTEASVIWPPDAKNQLLERDPDARKDWGQEKEVTEDEMVDDITNPMDLSLSKLQDTVKDREA